MRKVKPRRKRIDAPAARAGRCEELNEVIESRSTHAPLRSATNVTLTLKHFQRRREKSLAAGEGKRLYLRVGDEVNHLRYEEWGIGVVMEIMTSSIPGGTCLARVRFQDGQLRCFNNDLDNEACCYYFGVRRYWNAGHGVDAVRAKFFGRG